MFHQRKETPTAGGVGCVLCVCVRLWVLWACNVRLTPKQLNVEIQEIQVNIKRRNYVNQKSKQAWQLGSQQNIKAGHKSYNLYTYI